jgi:hypothetical protein
VPILFISGFWKAAYKYFNYFGPWTAFVQGPLLNLCLMNVITTALNGRPVKNRSLLPQPRSAPVLGRSNVKIPANEGLCQMTRSWSQGVRQISGTRSPQPSSADWQSAVSPAGSRLGGRTCQPRCHPAETLKKSALGIILSPVAKNVFIRAIHAIRGHPFPGNLSNYIKLNQTIEIMNEAPKGKIGRLPRAIQEQVNRHLENGEEARTLVAWLNALPAALDVQAVLAAEFARQPVREQNLSEWRQHGCQKWLVVFRGRIHAMPPTPTGATGAWPRPAGPHQR